METALERKNERRLNFSKLSFSSRSISTEEALKDVMPFNFDKDILDGNRKIIVTGCNKKK